GDPPIGLPTHVTLLGDGFEWSGPRFPTPKRVDEPALNTYGFEHEGTIVVWWRGRANGGDLAKLKAQVEGQVCKTQCMLFSETVASSGAGGDELFAKFPADLKVGTSEVKAGSTAATPSGGAAPKAADDDDVANVPMWKFLALAVGWAIFSLLMPCTYPMIPITISFFTKQASARHASTTTLSIVYEHWIVLSSIAMGTAVGAP